MGISHLNEGNIQAAFVELQKAYQISPDNKEILNSLGLVYLHLEEFEKAKDLFLRAVSIDSEFSEAYNHLGVTYSRRGQWTESIEAFKKALLNPLYQTPEMAFYNLGMAYYRVGQYEPAINAFKDAIKRVPLFPLPYYGLALAYNRESRYGDAAAIIARAIEIDTAYKGDKKKFIEDIKQKLLTSKGDEESDFRDYLEIMRY
ncbi:MAG: tetratricopeptide repeat protein [Nitrospiraceae bacterium]|nr:tetratricopeptide repeat protein [Nitrospiraceae bacterium]